MRSSYKIQAAALLALSALPFAALAASGDRFMNGESIFGRPTIEGTPVRIVDLGSTNRLNVAYGESVVFRNAGKQFSWTFDGLDHRPVDVGRIAPAGFTAKPFVIYIGRNPSNRN